MASYSSKDGLRENGYDSNYDFIIGPRVREAWLESQPKKREELESERKPPADENNVKICLSSMHDDGDRIRK